MHDALLALLWTAFELQFVKSGALLLFVAFNLFNAA
jgi:hypothetical protein